MPAGQQETVVLRRIEIAPRHRLGERAIMLELAVELDRLVLRAELPEQHAVEQPLIARGRRAAVFGREHDFVAGLDEQLPRHRDLGGVEVRVGQREQHTHPTMLANAGCYGKSARDRTSYLASSTNNPG